MKITVSRNAILAMQCLASRDSSRDVINGVAFDISGKACLLVATDGRKLGIMREGSVTDPMPGVYSLRIPPAMLKALPKASFDSVIIEILAGQSEANIKPSGMKPSFNAEIIKGTYPKWRQLVPNDPAIGQPIDPAFNWDLLNGFAQVAKTMKKLPYITLKQPGDPLLPFVVGLGEVPQFIGFLMPLRQNNDRPALPDWLKEEPKPQPEVIAAPRAEAAPEQAAPVTA